MTATANPSNGLPDNPPTITKEWALGLGETETREWSGLASDIDTKYGELITDAEGGGNISAVSFTNTAGRCRLVARMGRSGNNIPGYPSDVTVVEELYAVDVIKDLCNAPYFAETVNGGKGLPLSDDSFAFVRLCAENRFTEAEITAYVNRQGLDAGLVWSSWSTGMKELRYHLLRGVESFFETGFIYRRTAHGVQTSSVQAQFTGINTTQTLNQNYATDMGLLLNALPDGEWLKKPPQAEHIGNGRWRITEEWHWAEKWSVVYGGTWNGT